MLIYKNKSFARFARRNGLADADLCRAVQDANRGLIAADLGGGVIKQRLARPGEGKSGGFRSIVLFRAGDRAIFAHGFAKNEAENIRPHELTALKKLARLMLAYRDSDLSGAVTTGALIEVRCDDESEAVSKQADGVGS